MKYLLVIPFLFFLGCASLVDHQKAARKHLKTAHHCEVGYGLQLIMDEGEWLKVFQCTCGDKLVIIRCEDRGPCTGTPECAVIYSHKVTKKP